MTQPMNSTHHHQAFSPAGENAPMGLLQAQRPDPGKNPEATPAESVEAKEERRVLCRECLYPITREHDRTAIHGAHQHTFANPSGVIFTIGCFQSAEGCGAAGSPSDEFSWFSGFNWRVAVCTACLSHLGWLFSNVSGAAFWGLILDHLIFPDNR